MILLIDTSTRTARVGLIRDEKLIDLKEWESTPFDKTQGKPELGKKLLEGIDELLKEYNLELKGVQRVAVHRGQAGSSFMALRTGIVTATMLAEGVGAELVPIEGNEVETMVWQACQGKAVQVIEPEYFSSLPVKKS